MDSWMNLDYNLILRAISFRIMDLEKTEKNKEELKELKKEYKKILKLQQQLNK